MSEQLRNTMCYLENLKSNLEEFRKWKDQDYEEPQTVETNVEI